ncbi:hypothetical protein VULLAG_LOCUS19659 [Vulpes lagopus]
MQSEEAAAKLRRIQGHALRSPVRILKVTKIWLEARTIATFPRHCFFFSLFVPLSKFQPKELHSWRCWEKIPQPWKIITPNIQGRNEIEEWFS